MIHVVAVPGLAGASVAPAVVRDDAVALVGQKDHLRFPAVRAERPSVAEGDDRAVLGAPVLEVQAYAFGSDNIVAVYGGCGGGDVGLRIHVAFSIGRVKR